MLLVTKKILNIFKDIYRGTDMANPFDALVGAFGLGIIQR